MIKTPYNFVYLMCFCSLVTLGPRHADATEIVQKIEQVLKSDTAQKPHRLSPPGWLELSPAQRAKIVEEWYAQPETTRSPFPVYREQQMRAQKISGPADLTQHTDKKVESETK